MRGLGPSTTPRLKNSSTPNGLLRPVSPFGTLWNTEESDLRQRRPSGYRMVPSWLSALELRPGDSPLRLGSLCPVAGATHTHLEQP